MSILSRTAKSSALAFAMAAALLTAGCGGIGFEGPAAQALGLNGGKKVADKRVPDRAPLLLPPDRKRLPEPQQASANAPAENWPSDPDVNREVDEEEAKTAQKKYEDDGDWSKNAGIDEFEKLSKPIDRKEGLFKKFGTGILGN